MSLFKFYAENLFDFCFWRDIVRVNLKNAVGSLLFGLEQFQGIVIIARGDNAVRDFLGDELSRSLVTLVAQRDEVTERAHSVGPSGTGIGTGQGSELD